MQLRKQAQAGQGLCLAASSRSTADLELGTGLQGSCHTTVCLCASLPTGLLNPLDSPHHMRQDEESEFREGIVVDRPTRPGHGSFVNCGMKKVGIGRVGWDMFQTYPGHGGQAGSCERGALAPGICAYSHPTDADLGQRSAPKQGSVDKARSKRTVS